MALFVSSGFGHKKGFTDKEKQKESDGCNALYPGNPAQGMDDFVFHEISFKVPKNKTNIAQCGL